MASFLRTACISLTVCAVSTTGVAITALSAEQRSRGTGLPSSSASAFGSTSTRTPNPDEAVALRGTENAIHATVVNGWLSGGGGKGKALGWKVKNWGLEVRPDARDASGLGAFAPESGRGFRAGEVMARVECPVLLAEKARAGNETEVALAVERRLQLRRSPVWPYVASLPAQIESPLGWEEEEVRRLLGGTALARAVTARRRELRAAWDDRRPAADALAWRCLRAATRAQQEDNPLIGPVVDASMAIVGSSAWLSSFLMEVFGYRMREEDLVWASAAYRSRAMAIPGVGECLAPGLDFCNHGGKKLSNAVWDVEASRVTEEGQLLVYVSLSAAGGRRGVKPRDEIMIDYGELSNESLLMLHGFCIPENPNDALMMHIPLPEPEKRGPGFRQRLRLLAALGLRLQWFLKETDFTGGGGSRRTILSRAHAWDEDMLNTLRVFTLSEGEMASVDAAVAEGAGTEALWPSNRRARGEARGRALSLLKDLLQYDYEALCSASGPPENDVRVIQKLTASSSPLSTPTARRELYSALYRLGQKRMAKRALDRL